MIESYIPLKTIVCFLFVICWLFIGCKKEEPVIPLCNPEKFFPLKKGNYWILQNYTVFDNGTIGDGEIDSLYISSDTLMLGYQFFHLKGTFHRKPISHFLTATNGQIVSADHYVFYECPRLFDSKKLYPVMGFDFPAIINTTRKDTLIRVAAGDFEPVMLFESHSMLEDSIWIVTYKAYYSKHVGLVKFSSRCVGCNYENFSDLVRYHVEN